MEKDNLKEEITEETKEEVIEEAAEVVTLETQEVTEEIKEEPQVDTTEDITEDLQEEITEEIALAKAYDKKKAKEEDKKYLKSLPRKERKKVKKQRKIDKEFFRKEDVNFKAPLSYRHLRIIAWLAFALGRFCTVSQVTSGLSGGGFLSETVYNVLSIVASIYMPLFIIATFGTILNNKKSMKSVLIFYGLAYLGIGLGIVFVYHRYLNGILHVISSEHTFRYAGDLLGSRLEVNVFGDLLALSAFYFFIMYNPKKRFQGKKIIIFRLMSLIPLFIALISYVIRITSVYISLPIQIYPFLTTKSPMLYLLFVVLVLWLKKREKKYLSYGKTEEEYQVYLKTKKNQRSFSVKVSKLLAIVSALDFLVLFVLILLFGEKVFEFMDQAQVGECSLLFLAIPVIMFYSYTKTYDENSKVDILIPLIGIGLVGFAYLEGIYALVMYMMTE